MWLPHLGSVEPRYFYGSFAASSCEFGRSRARHGEMLGFAWIAKAHLVQISMVCDNTQWVSPSLPLESPSGKPRNPQNQSFGLPKCWRSEVGELSQRTCSRFRASQQALSPELPWFRLHCLAKARATGTRVLMGWFMAVSFLLVGSHQSNRCTVNIEF